LFLTKEKSSGVEAAGFTGLQLSVQEEASLSTLNGDHGEVFELAHHFQVVSPPNRFAFGRMRKREREYSKNKVREHLCAT
jgi:hypothetical protein